MVENRTGINKILLDFGGGRKLPPNAFSVYDK
jgi:hypothetical protein